MEGLVKKLIREMDYSISDEDLERKVAVHIQNINEGNYNFNNPSKTTLSQKTSSGIKKRVVYSFNTETTEYLLCQYLKKRLDSTFDIAYTNRKKIIKVLFNTLLVLNDLQDFVIIRFDFKSFFDSVSTKFVFTKYVQSSSITRYDKTIFSNFCNAIPYCYAGLQTSSAMTEIACVDFDKVLRAKLNDYGLVYCERYVDDVLIILNKYISESNFKDILAESIKMVFTDCNVSINPNKFNYIARRSMLVNNSFDFLGYLFKIKKKQNGSLSFKFGMTKSKIDKYTSKIRQTLRDYKDNNNLELLRHRIKIFSSRVVYSWPLSDENCNWITKGIVDSYNELHHHIEYLDTTTKKFLQRIYYTEMQNLNVSIPYFMNSNFSEADDSVYNLFSNMKRNRSIIFDEKIGVNFNNLINQIKKLEPGYYCGDRKYHQVTKDYLDFLDL